MNDGEKLLRMYSDDMNMMMLKMKYHENKEMMSLMIIVARTYWWCILYPSPLLTDSNGSEVCSDVVFHVNTNHSNNLNIPFFFKFHKFWICPPCLGPWPPRGAEGLRWHHQMTQTFKFWNSQAKDKRFHSLLPVALFVIFSLLKTRFPLTCQFFWRQLLYHQVQSCMQCSLPTIH